MKKILILCFLGDPTYPAGSISGTGGFNASVRDILSYIIDSPQFTSILITNNMGNHSQTLCEKISNQILLYRIILQNNQTADSYPISELIASTEDIIKDFSEISFIHSFYWLSGIVASILSDKYNVPFIHTTVSLAKEKIRNGFKPSVLHQLEYENIFLSKAKYILSITEEEKNLLIDSYNIPTAKIIIEGQTVAEEYHSPIYDNYGIPSTLSNSVSTLSLSKLKNAYTENDSWWNNKAFIYVGRITKVKGLDIIIQAWIVVSERFNNHIPPLWIVGNTPYEISSFRSTLGIDSKILAKYENEGKIVWWGYLSPSAISTLYLKACALVTHSAFESGGRMILEALCRGIPVITSNTGFGKDYIINWLNGFIVNYGDLNNLALRMSHFIRNPFLSHVLGVNAKNTFTSLENMWHHKIRIIQLYESLSKGNEYIYEANKYLPIETDVFKKGIIQTYPYYYLKKSRADIIEVLNTIDVQIDKPLKPLKLIQIKEKDIWQYSDKYVVKYVHTKLNKLKIWDISQKEDVLSEQNNIDKIRTISTLKPILKLLNIDSDNGIVVMPFIRILSDGEILQNYIAVAEVLSNIGIHAYDDNACSLSDYWSNTKTNIKLSNIKFSNILNLKMLQRAINHMEQITAPLSSDVFCIQYAQRLLGHIGLYNEKLTLLPTYHWTITERGLDAGLFFVELLYIGKDGANCNELEVLNSLSKIFNIPKHTILEWSFCICINCLIQNLIFDSKNFDYNIFNVIIFLLLYRV